MNRRVFITLFSAIFIGLGTFIAIKFAQGYRPTRQGVVHGTGLLAANSFPNGAEVYINGKLTTATDDTLNLFPNTYDVEITKDGYSTWKKKLTIEEELVTQTNARLFPTVPSLSPLTFTGVENVSPSPDGHKLLFYTSSASAEKKNGLYILDITENPLSLQRGPQQITQDSNVIDLATAHFIWSPDSSEVIVTDNNRHILLDLKKTVDIDTQQDITFKLTQTLSTWEEEMYLRERQILEKFPLEIIRIATQSATNVYFSPDQEKILYTATQSARIPKQLIPEVPATNTQPEKRDITPGGIYIYDRKEDKNFIIAQREVDALTTHKLLLATDLFSKDPITLEGSPSAFTRLQATKSAQTAKAFKQYHSGLFTGDFQWFPDSRHIIHTRESDIAIIEYDGTNETGVYAGPFDRSFVYPWSNGDSLIILTSFNPLSSEENVYSVKLK